ncbi:MAG: thiamine phosphate synthase, partial [Bacteroidota bacterium]
MQIQETKIILLSPPQNVENEHQILVQLFELGLQCFHLRKPDFSDIEYAQYLGQIPTEYWDRIVLHHHHHLAEQLSLGGVHLTERSRQNLDAMTLLKKIEAYQAGHLKVSAAIHDLKDLELLGQWCDYVLISPIFDSISKKEYKANSKLDLAPYLGKVKSKLFA